MSRFLLTTIFAVLGSVQAIASTTNDLELICTKIILSDTNEVGHAMLLQELNLEHADVSRFMLNKMNTLHHKGMTDVPASDVLFELLTKQPESGCQWLLDHCAEMSAVGRANTAESLRRMAIVKPCKEAYELLTSLLADTETVTNRHAQAVSLTPYVHFRVCDYAYNSLSYILKESKELSVDMPPAFLHGSSLDTRDNTIAKFKAWWKDHSTSILNAKPTVAVDRSAWSKKLQSLVFK